MSVLQDHAALLNALFESHQATVRKLNEQVTAMRDSSNLIHVNPLLFIIAQAASERARALEKIESLKKVIHHQDRQIEYLRELVQENSKNAQGGKVCIRLRRRPDPGSQYRLGKSCIPKSRAAEIWHGESYLQLRSMHHHGPDVNKDMNSPGKVPLIFRSTVSQVNKQLLNCLSLYPKGPEGKRRDEEIWIFSGCISGWQNQHAVVLSLAPQEIPGTDGLKLVSRLQLISDGDTGHLFFQSTRKGLLHYAGKYRARKFHDLTKGELCRYESTQLHINSLINVSYPATHTPIAHRILREMIKDGKLGLEAMGLAMHRI
ncbi:hypothetical protein D9758_005828 [Tetrapyrgos nigripes]|uniref:Uncharacterized protein n=1 Tax=Tetrapyrgos nigripes TaxID=182062 RepID=A0A8H5G2V8_9AGAR|nr:hypothetical protein D9758_005828 [Tetrapyrgos nigripes]